MAINSSANFAAEEWIEFVDRHCSDITSVIKDIGAVWELISFDAMPDTAILIAEKPPAVAMVMRVVRLPADARSYTAIVHAFGRKFYCGAGGGLHSNGGFIVNLRTQFRNAEASAVVA